MLIDWAEGTIEISDDDDDDEDEDYEDIDYVAPEDAISNKKAWIRFAAAMLTAEGAAKYWELTAEKDKARAANTQETVGEGDQEQANLIAFLREETLKRKAEREERVKAAYGRMQAESDAEIGESQCC